MKLKKLSKKDIQDEVNEIFYKKSNLTQKEIKKLKKLAMSKTIKLKGLRKKFCKKCFNLFTPLKTEIRIKKQNKIPVKVIKCKNCGYVSRWRIK